MSGIDFDQSMSLFGVKSCRGTLAQVKGGSLCWVFLAFRCFEWVAS